MQASNILMAWELSKDMLFAAFYYAISLTDLNKDSLHTISLCKEKKATAQPHNSAIKQDYFEQTIKRLGFVDLNLADDTSYKVLILAACKSNKSELYTHYFTHKTYILQSPFV